MNSANEFKGDEDSPGDEYIQARNLAIFAATWNRHLPEVSRNLVSEHCLRIAYGPTTPHYAEGYSSCILGWIHAEIRDSIRYSNPTALTLRSGKSGLLF